MGYSVTVAQLTLDQLVKVRILVPQPFFCRRAKNGGAIENRKSIMEHFLDCGLISIIYFPEVAFIFENLDVYQKALDFAEEVCELTKEFPKGNYYLSDQFNRAALSISTNIAEGNGRFHKSDRKNFFRIARGSAFECVPILEICRRKMLIGENKSKSLKITIEDICKMLSGLMK